MGREEGIQYRKRKVKKQEVHRSTQERGEFGVSVRGNSGDVEDGVRGGVRVKVRLERHPHT